MSGETRRSLGFWRCWSLVVGGTIGSAISGLILQNRDPSISRSHRLREGGVAGIAFGVCMWVIAASGFETVYWGFLLLMAGLPVYVIVTRVKQ